MGALLGSVLKRERVLAGMKQAELARAVRVKGPYVSLIEKGLREPSEGVRRALLECLNMGDEELQAKIAELAAKLGMEPEEADQRFKGVEVPADLIDLMVTHELIRAPRPPSPVELRLTAVVRTGPRTVQEIVSALVPTYYRTRYGEQLGLTEPRRDLMELLDTFACPRKDAAGEPMAPALIADAGQSRFAWMHDDDPRDGFRLVCSVLTSSGHKVPLRLECAVEVEPDRARLRWTTFGSASQVVYTATTTVESVPADDGARTASARHDARVCLEGVARDGRGGEADMVHHLALCLLLDAATGATST